MKQKLVLPFIVFAWASFPFIAFSFRPRRFPDQLKCIGSDKKIIGSDVFNIKDYGATGNGITLDSKAINAAIEAAAKVGGGTVYIPAGDYLSGSIRLKNNISLYLEQGSTIIAVSDDPGTAYDQAEPSVNTSFQDYGHSHWHNGFIWGDSLHDISITGPGKIWGRGLLKDWKKGSELADKTISLYRCRNVTIRDISILKGGWFAILATGVDNLTIDNVKLDTNRDGMDIDCCKNVRISNCYVNSPYDDGICLKSSFGLGYARATENVTITNCQVSGYDEGTLLDGTFQRSDNPAYHLHPTGRIKFGTESNGGFKNITISNCVFDYCRGLALETVDGALLEDVTITNITMRDIVNDPIFLRLGSRMRGPAGTPVGELRRVLISNIMVYDADPNYACTISGTPGHDIEDIRLSNIHVFYRERVDLIHKGGNARPAMPPVPENENKYPEPGMFGPNPACALFLRHAKNIELADIEFNSLSAGDRPALLVDDVKGIYLQHVRMERTGTGPKLVLKNSSALEMINSLGLPDQQIKTVSDQSF
jgi:polygalacturonase